MVDRGFTTRFAVDRTDISEKDGQTEVRFTHRGLVPAYECFGVCSNAWGFYVNGSLRSSIATGEGQPNRRDRSHLPAVEAAGQGRHTPV